MLLRNLFLLIFALGAIAITGCDDDDDVDPHGDNTITIRFLEPANDAVVADASDVHIHIEIEASDENHEVEIVLHPEGDTGNKIIDFDLHEHDKLIVFEQDVDLSAFPGGTEFHIEVEACTDHDCEEKESDDIHFSIP